MPRYDVLIVGSGFAGALTALCLAQEGFNVCIVEKESHPRFAIGESSTPVADLILRDLADRYNLPWLRQLSRYGSWQKHHPDIICGLKRGFSYYKHKSGEKFTTDQYHQHELLVAASTSDQNSDTHWLRSDLDYFLIRKVQQAGIKYVDYTMINQLNRNDDEIWTISASREKVELNLAARFIIDATGSAAFSEKFFDTRSASAKFLTNSRAIFSHFTGVTRWFEYIKSHDFKTEDYPFNPDHSALHHIINEGWFWMLRFNNERLSAGIAIDQNNSSNRAGASAEDEWLHHIEKYPTLKQLFEDSKASKEPGAIISTGRLQRRLNRVFGNGWVALHHTAGFVDPLHSTGIAHSLSGVEKILNLITRNQFDNITTDLKSYEKEFMSELSLIDKLVSGCYKSRHHFDLFIAFSMLYFVCTINYEQNRLSGEYGQFLSADNKQMRTLVDETYQKLIHLLQHGADQFHREKFIEELRQDIKPFNIAGLMDPEKRNMYIHTAVQL